MKGEKCQAGDTDRNRKDREPDRLGHVGLSRPLPVIPEACSKEAPDRERQARDAKAGRTPWRARGRLNITHTKRKKRRSRGFGLFRKDDLSGKPMQVTDRPYQSRSGHPLISADRPGGLPPDRQVKQN